MAADALTYYDGFWGSARLVIDGTDVTNFRGTSARIGSLGFQDPFVWGPADFRVVNIEQSEEWGVGELSWLKPGATVEVIQVDETGDPVRLIWKGFILRMTSEASEDQPEQWVDLQCDGFISGRLALRDWHGPTHDPRKDYGRHIWDALKYCKIPADPILGLETGTKEKIRLGPSSMLEFVQTLLTMAPRDDGAELTITVDPYDLKGRARIAYREPGVIGRVFLGAPGIHLTAGRDLTEEPTSVFGRTKSKGGELQRNVMHPLRMQGDPEPPPDGVLPLSIGDSGPWVALLKGRLIGLGLLDREDAWTEVNGVLQRGTRDDFDAATRDAVRLFQKRRRGLPNTGVVNEATWNAFYDAKRTRRRRRAGYVAPLAEIDATRRWNYTATGVAEAPNPNYQPRRIEVDRSVEAPIPKRRLARWADNWLDRIHANPPHVGTLTIKTDVFAAGHVHGDTPAEGSLLSRFDAGLIVGRSIDVVNYQGGVDFHVAGATVTFDPPQATLEVDSAGRSLEEVLEIIEARRANRATEGKSSVTRHKGRRGKGVGRHHGVRADENAGHLADRRKMGADRWNIVKVEWGEFTHARRIRIHVTNSECEFFAAMFNEPVTSAQAKRVLGNPTLSMKWAREGLAADWIDDERLLWAEGTPVQPCGYSPGMKYDPNEFIQAEDGTWVPRSFYGDWVQAEDGTWVPASYYTEPSDPLTGKLFSGGPIPLHMSRHELKKSDVALWLAIWPRANCSLDQQRLIWPVVPDND